jgi:hypothetical protein
MCHIPFSQPFSVKIPLFDDYLTHSTPRNAPLVSNFAIVVLAAAGQMEIANFVFDGFRITSAPRIEERRGWYSPNLGTVTGWFCRPLDGRNPGACLLA